MGVYGNCGLWFDHACGNEKPFVCEFSSASEVASTKSKKDAGAASGAHAGLALGLSFAALLVLVGAGLAAYRKRMGPAGGYGDVARSYRPPDAAGLPSYDDYVFNPAHALEIGAPQGI